MKFKLSHLLVIASGVLVVFLLGLLPKYVVSDKEKRIKQSEQEVKQQVLENNAQHGDEKIDTKRINSLQNEIDSTSNALLRFRLIDSMAVLYKDAFMLDSSVAVYMSYASDYKEFYLRAIRDGLTGLRMSPSDDKKKYYATICKQIIETGLATDTTNLELQVEALRFEVFSAAMSGQPPMSGIFKLKALIAEHPDLLVGRVALAEFYTTVGKTDEAIQQYLQVLDYEKDNLQAHVELVSLYLGTNQNALAKEYLTRLQEINNTDKDLFIQDFINKSFKKLN